MTETLTHTGTLIDALAAAVRAVTAYDPNTQAAPACVVWTDKKEEWKPMLPRLRAAWPHLLTYGEYDPDTTTGPAIWIKTALQQSLSETTADDDLIPIVYLPGVSRSTLRHTSTLTRELQPLAELQHRGVLFSQFNGRDWTVLAFLTSQDGGLGLDVARDADTAEAMARALTKLADVALDRLAGRRLEADDFNELLAPDPHRDILHWLNDPEAFRQAQGEQQWGAFCSVCRKQFKLDPEQAGILEAAQRLGKKKGPWKSVWERFADAPHKYPQLPERLSQAKPAGQTGDLFGSVQEAWPQDNGHEEEMLRAALLSLSNATSGQAAERLRLLEERHGMRRQWIWAELGKAPLARALKQLLVLAEAVNQPVGGATVEACAAAYMERGWKADDAYMRTLAAGDEKVDLQAVHAVATVLYRPWLEQTATTFEAVLGGSLPPQPNTTEAKPKAGCVWLFVDALRLDAGMRLRTRLVQGDIDVSITTRWAAFPSLTPTAKPAVSPVAHQISRQSTIHDFSPETEAGPLSTYRFRSLLKDAGFQVLAADETGDPTGSAWTEFGTIDTRGHELGWKLSCRLDELLGEVHTRIDELLKAGWKEVRIVTDHGWLILRGGLPKTELPKVLTKEKWGRCAEIKGGSQINLPTHGWFWNPDVRIAVTRGIHVFMNGKEYAHGGLTLQECLVPELTITGGASADKGARIVSAQWLGLRCRVEIEGPAADYTVDLRRYAGDAASTVASKPKRLVESETSLIVPDDMLEGKEAVVVLLDLDGRLIHQMKTTIGG